MKSDVGWFDLAQSFEVHSVSYQHCGEKALSGSTEFWPYVDRPLSASKDATPAVRSGSGECPYSPVSDLNADQNRN